ncbi:hypothetical protein B9T31_03595 [Acinetobacter sp. ANC 4558]|uniref:DUF3465 domain-containing protein n=1 Tax=Acinetobacter sp. ANC 4558 TaxID=1977876 RepID=UPI000A348EAC|nr:DUF3465 domain-containing protein [Acinetobacter sp. ANC 4558]OTG87594.1 hypothetical protein B9T31_03595 [Acinetobacter sp. ANC 4558]
MFNKINYGIAILVIILIAIYFTLGEIEKSNDLPRQDHLIGDQQHSNYSTQQQHGLELIAHAYKNKLSNIQVHSTGRVVAVLPDDNEGSRHQKFVLELANGQTILIAHNIDLAPSIKSLQKGDMVEFYGVYEYSSKGGVIHWTHHDPRGRHIEGWLMHQGEQYK